MSRIKLSGSKLPPPCSVAELRNRLDYDPHTGVFFWKVAHASAKVGSVAGYLENNYWKIGVLGTNYRAHRLAWYLVHSEWPLNQVDHINGDQLDNRITNLRLATYNQNQSNRRMNKNKSTGAHKGVYWNKKCRKWMASLTKDGKYHYLGLFDTEAAAAEAHRMAAEKLQGEFALHLSRASAK